MVRMSSLILTSKRSPFVPIEFYRDLPHPREFLGDQAISYHTFSPCPLRTRASPQRRESGREFPCPLLKNDFMIDK
jgi:hypothetical protein